MTFSQAVILVSESDFALLPPVNRECSLNFSDRAHSNAPKSEMKSSIIASSHLPIALCTVLYYQDVAFLFVVLVVLLCLGLALLLSYLLNLKSALQC